MTKTPPSGTIVTDFQKAKAGDVLDVGEGSRYRYLLLSSAPVWRRGLWYVGGNRWMFSRQSFAQKGLAFYAEGPAPISDAECDAYIMRLAAADLADGIE